MVHHTKRLPYTLLFSFSILLLAIVTSACSFGGSGSGSTPTPTPTPTTAPLTAFKGTDFTINYPQNWKAKTDSTGVTFTDPSGIAYFQVHEAPDPDSLVSASQEVTLGLDAFKSQAKNYQQQSVASTTTVAGETWSQGAATGDITPSGQKTATNVKIIIIADNHPPSSSSTKAFIIGYATGTQVFDLANSGYFQPMLQSFKFTA
jgi:hypothetical protein